MSSDSEVDSDELDPDEPRTPLWLPLLGAGLFLMALLLFLATRSEDEVAPSDGEPAADTAAEAAAEPGAAQPEEAAQE